MQTMLRSGRLRLISSLVAGMLFAVILVLGTGSNKVANASMINAADDCGGGGVEMLASMSMQGGGDEFDLDCESNEEGGEEAGGCTLHCGFKYGVSFETWIQGKKYSCSFSSCAYGELYQLRCTYRCTCVGSCGPGGES